ncbi:hypothetical protein N802_10890 [Knoellia sinensis KCTC 19936]|uniref:Peptidase C60 n=1 Tax=Knoellia sinensis KCTC 19936 TaxID=1385520 RepID=A0A0A0J987_9MICO|nr:class F sortase [Knoellia sinensis]KGN32176.1 hypothetical protein N802_10890 [Knoellia sinensis KCTC 19936]
MRELFERWAGPTGPAHRLRPFTPLVGAVVALALAVVLSVLHWGDSQPSVARSAAASTDSQSSTTSAPAPTASPSDRMPTKSATASPRTTTTTATVGAEPMAFAASSIDVSGRLQRVRAVNGVVNPASGVLGWVSGYGRVRPGEVGTAVIAGHVVNGERPDVFYNLQDIDRGDKVTVVDAQGQPRVYTVTATRVATKEAVSRDAVVWGGNSSVRRIALITCDDDDGYRPDGHRVSNFVAIAEVR